MEKIKVLIADDHPLIREGLTRVLSFDSDIEVVGQAENGEDAVVKSKDLQPHVILMDINMPVLDGIGATREIKQLNPAANIIALTVMEEEDKIIEVIKAGVTGYLLKDVAPDILVAAIKSVFAGETIIPSKVTTKIFGEAKSIKDDSHSLSEREIEILKMIAGGNNNREIANGLFISEKTVKNHITNIFKKIGVCDRTQAALYAIKNKLIEMDS